MSIERQSFINRITTKLATLECERAKCLSRLAIKQTITFVIMYFSYKGIFIENHNDFMAMCVIVLFFSSIFFFYNFSDDNKEFKKLLKQKCKTQILKTFNLNRLSGQGFSDDVLKRSNLFSIYTNKETDDVFEGTYKDANFTIAETKLIMKTKKNEFTIFNGVIIAFKSNKKIKSETLVTSKGDNNIRNYPASPSFLIAFIIVSIIVPIIFVVMFLSMIAQYLGDSSGAVSTSSVWFMNLSQFILPLVLAIGIFILLLYKQMKKMQKVNLEDVSFEKQFNVYAQDQIEARYLLTPTFMERLKSINTSFGTKGIKCSFFDDYIMFAISTKKDLFELGSLYKSLKSRKLAEDFYDELHSIHEMIDHLKLNEKIGL